MISQAVEDRVIDKIDDITDVTVHIDPEDDEDAPTCRYLPLRADAMQALERTWDAAHVIPAQREIRLHYLSGKIDVELILPLSSYSGEEATRELHDRLVAASAELDWFGGLRLLYS